MKAQYENQRRKVKARNIDWLFTYETWLDWWKSTGKLAERGRKSSEYCMCRIGDEGPYSPENVYCATNDQNAKDSYTNNKNQSFNKRTFEQMSAAGSKGGKIAAGIAKARGKELSEEHLNLIKDIDKTKYGWVAKASRILDVSHTQVKRLVDKYYVGEIYRR